MTAPADPAPLDATLSVTRAARLLGVHPNTVRSWSEEGRLRHYRINARGDRRYRAADLRQFLSAAERGMAMVRGRPPATRSRHIGVATTARRPEGGRATEIGRVSAPTPPGPTLADLTDLVALVAGPGTTETLVTAAARRIRKAFDAHDASVWAQPHDGAVWRMAGDAPVAPGGGPSSGATHHAPVPLRDLAAAAVAQRRPVVADSPGTAATTGDLVIAVPIPAELEPWGALTVWAARQDPDRGAVDWLESAAAILGGAIRATARLERATEEIHRGEALRRVALDTTGSLDLDETLIRLVDHALVLFSADRGSAIVFGDGGEVARDASRGLLPRSVVDFRNPSEGSLARLAIERRGPVVAHLPTSAPGRLDREADVGGGIDGAARAEARQEGHATICAAPLLDGDDAVGVIMVVHDSARGWEPSDLETMALFATQATVAVRTALQHSQLERWAAQLQSIHQLVARLNRITTVPELASAIATELRLLIDADNVRVYRLQGDDLVAIALNATDEVYFDETPDTVRSRVGIGITGWVAAHGLAQNLPDTSADPRTEDIPGSDLFDESMLLAPMIFEDRVLGVIALASRGLHRFDDDDLRLLDIYASFAAQAIAHAETTERLHDRTAELRRQLRGQRELLDIGKSILSTLDATAVLNRIADRLGRLVRYDALTVEVSDRPTGTLVPMVRKGSDAGPNGTDDELARWVIDHDEPRLVPPSEAMPSRIAVPLRAHDGVRGVLSLARAADLDCFTGDEFDLVQLFAAQVSVALQNAETHRAVAVRAQTDDLTGLLNHGSLREWLARSIAVERAFSLIMLDLDRFKSVNDAFGHQAGDRLLAEIGSAIVAAGRDADRVFRYGGDEFAILLPATDREAALTVAERVMRSVRDVARRHGSASHVDGGSPGVRISASIGVAGFPVDAQSADDVLLAADRACFVAKRNGGDRIADAASGLALAAEFSLQAPTPVDPIQPAPSRFGESA